LDNFRRLWDFYKTSKLFTKLKKVKCPTQNNETLYWMYFNAKSIKRLMKEKGDFLISSNSNSAFYNIVAFYNILAFYNNLAFYNSLAI